MPRPLIVIPTYNERENITLILDAIEGLDAAHDILVVDDNSPDGTGQIVAERAPRSAHLHLLSRAGKQGLGKAYIAGFRWALERQYTHIFEMDADFSHAPEDLARLLQACTEGGYDIAVGSRFVRGGRVVNWGLYRKFLSRGASYYVQAILGMSVKDPTAGYMCYKKEVLEAIDLDRIASSGYGFQIEMKYRAVQHGFNICEVPITFKDRERGVSKLDLSIIREAILGVWRMRFR